MKRILFVVAALLCLAACDPAKWMKTHDEEWYLKNISGKSFTVRYNWGLDSQDLQPGDSLLLLYRSMPLFKGDPTFERFYGDLSKENRTLSLLSEDGQILKTWSVREKDSGGRQLFKESFWRKYQDGPTGDASSIHVIWVFDVIPEDIGD